MTQTEMQARRFLITGARGCIGAWVLKNLLEKGYRPVIYDIDSTNHRYNPLISDDLLAEAKFVQGDVANYSQVERAVVENGITHIVHLAGLQVPSCAADPIKGAITNVVGTLSLFEVARRHTDVPRYIVFSSSAAVFGSPELYGGGPVGAGAVLRPATHYGVFKCCNEENARIYFEDSGISSACLRPWAVYGFGRDRGRSSGPTKAIKASVLGRPYVIPFTGGLDLQYVDDVANLFIQCAEASLTGARLYTPRGEPMVIEEFIGRLGEVIPASIGLIRAEGPSQRLAYDMQDEAFARDFKTFRPTSLQYGIRRTAEIFEILRRAGKLDAFDLENL